MGFTMDIGDGLIRIEENVPPYQIFTVELRMGDRQHVSYMTLHDNYAEAYTSARKIERMCVC